MSGYKTLPYINAPSRYVSPDGFALGKWLDRQRLSRNRGKLSEERIARLDQLGMRWSPAMDKEGKKCTYRA